MISFPLLDGTPVSGPGGYTSQSIREVWRQRVQQKLSWEQTGSHADTTEAIERTLAIVVRYMNCILNSLPLPSPKIPCLRNPMKPLYL